MKKIDFMIGGMQKCGTTSLIKYLAVNRSITIHPQMEMTYFYLNEEFKKGWNYAYKRYFPNKKEDKYLLAKHSTLIRSENALKRLRDHNANIKLIIILRDPVERAWSSFLMEIKNGEKSSAFSETVDKIIPGKEIDYNDWRQNIYIGLGIYVQFIEKVFNILNTNQVKIIFLEELKNNPNEIMGNLLFWMGLNSMDISESTYTTVYNQVSTYRSRIFLILRKRMMNNSFFAIRVLKKIIPIKMQVFLNKRMNALNEKKINKPELDLKIKEKVQKFYKPYNEELFALLNKKNIWSYEY